MDEYRVKVTVRNNLLLSAIESAGYASQTEFARACELNISQVNALVALRRSPLDDSGSFSMVASTIMEVLGCAPSDLWTEAQMTMKLKRNSGERAVSELDVQGILENHIEMMTLPSPEDDAIERDKVNVVEKALNILTEREARIIRMRFIDELDRAEIGNIENVSSTRIMQIENKALRKLRYPHNAAIFEGLN